MKKTMTKIAGLLVAVAMLGMTGMAAVDNVAMDVSVIKTEPTPLQTSEYADVWVKVRNTGNTAAEGVELEYEPTFPFEVDPDEKTEWEIGRLVPGAEFQARLQVKVDANAVSGLNDLAFTTRTDSGIEVTRSLDVKVRTDDEALVVTDVGFPGSVQPGTANQLSLTVTNLADSLLKNIDLDLAIADEMPFVTAETTRRRIQSLKPGGSETVSYTINVDEDAANGVYSLPIEMDYENDVGTAFEQEEQTGIVIGGASSLQAAINSKTVNRPGMRGTVTLRLVNRGEGRAKFVSMELAETGDYEILSPASVYLGNMDSDDFQTAEFDLFMKETAEGAVSLPVTLNYTAADGTEQSVTQEMTIDLYSQQELERFGETGGSMTWWLIAAAIIVIGGGIYLWRR